MISRHDNLNISLKPYAPELPETLIDLQRQNSKAAEIFVASQADVIKESSFIITVNAEEKSLKIQSVNTEASLSFEFKSSFHSH